MKRSALLGANGFYLLLILLAILQITLAARQNVFFPKPCEVYLRINDDRKPSGHKFKNTASNDVYDYMRELGKSIQIRILDPGLKTLKILLQMSIQASRDLENDLKRILLRTLCKPPNNVFCYHTQRQGCEKLSQCYSTHSVLQTTTVITSVRQNYLAHLHSPKLL
ncbi:hypothetical protein CVS40_12561 [Lucilia cuprina]|nr:hypothetical protein CVS40_12561 [Lucilia cuprina]